MSKHRGWFVSGDTGKPVGYKTAEQARRVARSLQGGKVEGPLSGALRALFKGKSGG